MLLSEYLFKVPNNYFCIIKLNVLFSFALITCLSLLDKPGPPAGEIQFKKITADSITIMWDPPADEGGAMVSHYIVEKRESSRIMWSIISEKLEECIVSVSRLIKGNEYIFRVRGVNKYGIGDPIESEPVIAQNSFGKCSFQS